MYISLLGVARVVIESQIVALLQEAAGALQDAMEGGSNNRLSGNGFVWIGENNMDIRVWNTNNQQMAWSVVNTAMSELYTYMVEDVFGTVDFTIYDGANEVGQGSIQ